MKINHKILSLPPYVSTSWKNVSLLSMEEGALVILLHDGAKISIPGLDNAIVEEIFTAYERHVEADKPTESGPSFEMPMLGTGGMGLEVGGAFGPFMQHSQELANTPDFPKEMLDKVARVAKTMGLDPDQTDLPKAEPHCNCPYCQVARALFAEEQEEEEIVSDDELTFREWDIEEIGKHQFTVTNPIDTNEVYHVYLGEPVGCTCGVSNCEHINAALRS